MYPFTPNSPKNCHSSWPDTNPAPKKHPAKANASGMIFISFMFTLPLTIYVYYNKAPPFRQAVFPPHFLDIFFTKSFGKTH